MCRLDWDTLTVNVLVGVGTDVGSRALHITDLVLRVVHGTLLVKLHLVLWVHLLLVFPGKGRKGLLNVLGIKDTVVLHGLHTVLVVVDVLLDVDGLSSLNALLGTDMLLDDLGSNFGAYLPLSARAQWSRSLRTSVESPLLASFKKVLTACIVYDLGGWGGLN